MARRPHVLLVEARFYVDIADQMALGASRALAAADATHDRQAVPGTFEVPAAIAMALEAAPGRYDGFVALGCVIRGETDHYDHICREASRALMDLATERGVPLGFGILTCDTYEQAWVRASVDDKNKGADAAEACLAMIELRTRLKAGDA